MARPYARRRPGRPARRFRRYNVGFRPRSAPPGEHTAELAAAENPDRAPGLQMEVVWLRLVGRRSATSAVRVRQARARRELPVGERENGGREQRGVVRAASPIARVPTGTPPGIWTMERRLSRPVSALIHRHAEHRKRRQRSGHAGRCAAPPAPAMIDLEAHSLRALAKATMRSGVRCAETIRASCRCRARPASRPRAHGRPIDWLPMMIATGFGAPLTAPAEAHFDANSWGCD